MEPIEIFVSYQNSEQNVLNSLLANMSQYIDQGLLDNENTMNLINNIFQEFINIHPEPISENNSLVIRWSILITDDYGNKLPMNYELAFTPLDVEIMLSKKKPKVRETTEHLASYKKIKSDDPLLTETCSICHDNYQIGQYKRVLEKCNHVFHKKCVDKWFVSNPNLECPLCRTNYNK